MNNMKYLVKIGLSEFEFKNGLEAMYFAQLADGSYKRGKNYVDKYPTSITIIRNESEEEE